jgi:TetR/AcrR family transcriptional regulator
MKYGQAKKRSGVPVAAVRRRNGEASREQILEAATREFSMKGLDGARVDEIARTANVNKQMIYHYFDSKERLFIAVLERTYKTVRDRQQDLSLRNLAPEAAMRRLVEFTADVWIDMPEFTRLLASENLHQAAHVRQSEVITSMYHPLVETLRELLARGAKEGIFRKNIDPIDLYISITSLSAHYVAHRYTFEAIFDTKLMTPKRLRQRKDTICDMIIRYLRPEC